MPYDVRPTTGDLNEARAVAEVALDGADRTLPADDRVLEVGLCWSGEPQVAEAYGGAAATCHGPERVSIAFNSRPPDWTDAVLAATARGAGRAWLQARLPDGRLAFRWQAILADAAGSAVAASVAPETPTPCDDRSRLRAWWPTLKERLDAPVSEPFDWSDTGDDLPDPPSTPLAGLGAVLAASTDLETLPELTHTGVLDRLEAGLTN